ALTHAWQEAAGGVLTAKQAPHRPGARTARRRPRTMVARPVSREGSPDSGPGNRLHLIRPARVAHGGALGRLSEWRDHDPAHLEAREPWLDAGRPAVVLASFL